MSTPIARWVELALQRAMAWHNEADLSNRVNLKAPRGRIAITVEKSCGC